MNYDPEVLSLMNAKGEEVANVSALPGDGGSLYFPPLRYNGSLKDATLWIGKYQAHDVLGNVVDPSSIKTSRGLWSGVPFMPEPTVRKMYYGDHADEYA